MSSILEQGFVVWGSDTLLLQSVSDIAYYDSGSGRYLIVGSEAESAVTVLDITDPGAIAEVSSVEYGANSGTLTLTDLLLLERPGGPLLLTLGRYDDNYGVYSIGSDGVLSFDQSLTGAGGAFNRGYVSDGFTTGGNSYFYAAGFGVPGFSVFAMNSAGSVSLVESWGDTPDRALGDVTAIHTAELFGQQMLFVASSVDAGLQSYLVASDGSLTEVDLVLPEDEDGGFAGVTAMDSVQIGDRAFLVVAGAQSDTLTVLRVSQNGYFNQVDQVYDTRDTRFGAAQDVEVFEAGGRTFVVAGGGDDGITLFEMDYRGRLVHLGTVADDFTTTLDNVSAIEVAVTGTDVRLYIGSGTENGVTEYIFDATRSGQDIRGDAVKDDLTGTSGDDVIWGMGKSDTIDGGAGDDRLIDGRGRDTLTGGAGEDVFVFTDDGRSDFVTDFEIGVDKIDLSDFDGVYYYGDITIGPRKNGAAIIVGDDVIRLTNPDGGPYDTSQFTQDDFIFG